jgi:hypothetical protein
MPADQLEPENMSASTPDWVSDAFSKAAAELQQREGELWTRTNKTQGNRA